MIHFIYNIRGVVVRTLCLLTGCVVRMCSVEISMHKIKKPWFKRLSIRWDKMYQALPVLKPEYSGRTRSIPWLLKSLAPYVARSSIATILPLRDTKCYVCVHEDHYSHVIMSAMASQITSVSIVYSTVCSGAEENIKALRHWPLWGEFTGDRWIPRIKGQ